MLPKKTANKFSLVWKGLTLDNYPLQLTNEGLEKIISKLPKQPELKSYVKRNYQGNLQQAVARSIAQLARDALYTGCVFHPDFSKKLRVFKTEGIQGRNYHILAFPLSKTESAIVAIQLKEQASAEEESGPATIAWVSTLLSNPGLLSNYDKPEEMLRVAQMVKQSLESWQKFLESLDVKVSRQSIKGVRMTPDISFTDSKTNKRVYIQIDTKVDNSLNHEKNDLPKLSENKVVFYIIHPDTGELRQMRIYNPDTKFVTVYGPKGNVVIQYKRLDDANKLINLTPTQNEQLRITPKEIKRKIL